MAHGGADAIRAGIAAADDDDVLVLCGDVTAVLMLIEQAFGVRRKKVHGEMNALELAALDGQIARLGRAGADDNGVEIVAQFFSGIIFADLGIGDKRDAFLRHEIHTALNDLFVELHVRDAVHEGRQCGPRAQNQ